MAFIKKAGRFAKKAKVGKTWKKARGAIKKRYGRPGGRSKLAQDVAMLKAIVNVEKKRKDFTQVSVLPVGALNGVGVSGAQCINISPLIAQGVTQGTRNGNSLKLTSACFDIQFAQQTSTVNDLKVRWVIICRPDNGATYSASTVQDTFYEPNPFSSVVDYYSSRDPEYFTDFRVIKQGVVDLKQDQVTSGQSIIQKKIPLRLNHHQKYNTDASTATVKNAFFLLVTCSGGDIALSTGVSFAYNVRWYYTDN
nr:capsid protein [Cressdnaviricota sp.]